MREARGDGASPGGARPGHPPESIAHWPFDRPNLAFGGLKPVEVIERGQIDRIWEMVFHLRAGTVA